uniref:Uncharacterized protein n=1 Tax=Setaria italica TaxID=4555 RepID=K3Y0T6_SETIT
MTGDWSSMAPLFRVQALKRHRYPSICIPIRHCTVQSAVQASVQRLCNKKPHSSCQ